MNSPSYRIDLSEYPHLRDGDTGLPKWRAVVTRLSDNMPCEALLRPTRELALTDAQEWVRLETARLALAPEQVYVDDDGRPA